MKKMLTGIVCLALLSCNRNKDQEFTTNIPPQQTNQLMPWLEKQKANVASESGKQAIADLEASLLINESVIRPAADGKQVMLTPIKPAANRENQAASTFLLLQLKSDGTIAKGNIVTYTPETATAPVAIPADLFEKYYGDGKLPDIKLNFKTLTGRPIFESSYRNGNLYAQSFPENKNRGNKSSTASREDCVEWYWQTYVNGVLVSEVYLGTTCGPYVEEGNNNGGTVEDEEAVRYPEWVVLQNPRIGENGVGEIKSHETLRGKRNSTFPDGGYFTQNSHAWSYCNFCMDPSDVWSETSSSSTHTALNATTIVSGHLHYQGDNYYNLSGSKTWNFREAFN